MTVQWWKNTTQLKDLTEYYISFYWTEIHKDKYHTVPIYVPHYSNICITLFQYMYHTVPNYIYVPHCPNICITLFQYMYHTVPIYVSHCSNICITLFQYMYHTVPIYVPHCFNICITLFTSNPTNMFKRSLL